MSALRIQRMAFGTRLSTPVWIAIIAGGSFFLIVVAIAMVAVVLIKRKRRRALSERRLSRYPGGHLCDADLARLPSVRAVLRKSDRTRPYGRSWVAAASRDSLVRRSILLNSSTPDQINAAISSKLSCKPASRPMIRSKRMLLTPMQALPLEPIIERSAKSTEKSPYHVPEIKLAPTVSSVPPTSHNNALDPINYHGNSSELSFGSQRANPSSHEQLHRYSGGANGVLFLDEQDDCQKSDTFTQPERSQRLNTVSVRPNLHTSTSLISQTSGHAPKERMPSPVPSLPQRVQVLREHNDQNSKRASFGSLASISSSILGDGDSNPLTSSITDYASTCAFSPFNSYSSKRSPHFFDGESNPWNWSKMKPAYSSQSFATTIQPRTESQRSSQASIEKHQFPGSASSGLSLSLVDKLTPSRSSPNVPQTAAVDREHLETLNKLSGNTSYQNNIGNMLSTCSSEIIIERRVQSGSEVVYRESKNKRASTSILQDTSGNQASPFRNLYQQRPSSIATDQPLRWDAETSIRSGRPSATTNRHEGHKRQPCQRIVFTTPISTPSRFASLAEEPNEAQETTSKSIIPGPLVITRAKNSMLQRPPSQTTFEPRIKISPPRTNAQSEDQYYSATMSMYKFHKDGDDTSPDFTPTRKPSRKRRTHKSEKDALRDQHNSEWPLVSSAQSQPMLPERSTSSTVEVGPVDFRSQVPSSHIPPPPFSFSFPAPPPKAPDWHRPSAHVVHGPRAAPPCRARSPRRRSPRQLSPLRNVARYSPHYTPQTLLASAAALRRMNSEVSTSDHNERKPYTNLGGGVSVLKDEHESKSPPIKASNYSLKSAEGNSGPSLSETGITFEWQPNIPRRYERSKNVNSGGEKGESKAQSGQSNRTSWYDQSGFLKEQED